ncbi:DUF927 domain-containing protein [Marinobacterium aestuariivivens]|uniref:DUF927 domain-containing protein n=1 Tax=Marinobacterium aestuariivivens TaxID=1698799 RepID=A0ABW1ZZ48_9GAMM
MQQQGVQLLGDDDKSETITTKPVTVKAGTRDTEGNNWGVLVWWLDQDDRPHEIAIPKRLFHAQGTELAQRLADGGLPIVPGKERKLLTYLAMFNVQQRLVAASCTGWLRNAFVLPNETINAPAGESIVYQPTGLSNHARAMRRNGTLEQWQAGVLDASPMVRFLICASLSAPVRYPVGVEAGGFHIYDETSRGKTTALQAAASCWGSGVDPQRAGGAETYISRWNATANALEAKAELHNDLPMVVDEIGEGIPGSSVAPSTASSPERDVIAVNRLGASATPKAGVSRS